jgi:hypothetical protein
VKISEQQLDKSSLRNIIGAAKEGADLLKIDVKSSSDLDIIDAIDLYVSKIQDEEISKEIDIWTDISIPLGCLWAEVLTEKLGWEWGNVTFHEHDDTKAYGIFSKDRALAIYPFHFIFGCIENKAPVTITLSYRMLIDGASIPRLPPMGYENVMDNVHHIIPPK